MNASLAKLLHTLSLARLAGRDPAMVVNEQGIETKEQSRKFALRLTALLLLPAALFSIVGMQVYRVTHDFLADNEWIVHTLQVKQKVITAVGALRDAEAAARAYVVVGDPQRLSDYYEALPRIGSEARDLTALIVDNPPQLAAAKALSDVLSERRASMAAGLSVFQTGGMEAIRKTTYAKNSQDEDDRISVISADMLAREDDLLARRRAEGAQSANKAITLTLSAVAISFAMIALAMALTLREQRRRLRSEASLLLANQNLESSLAESQRLGDTLHRLSSFGDMLQGCQSIDEALAGLRSTMPALLPDFSGAINLINASQNLVESVIAWGPLVQAATPIFAPDDCWALRRGHAYPEADSAVAFTCRHLQPLHELATPSHSLCTPLLAQGEMLGTLLLVSSAPIDASARGIIAAVVDHIAMAIANLKLQETLRTQSLRDPLTSLFNRRYLEASFERELARAKRHSLALSVLMLDIDHFKRFNDQYGHDAGDALLVQFAQLLTSVIRAEDVACRYGGEEFTILLQEADANAALARAEEIRAKTQELRIEHRRQWLGAVTVSIGIAAFPRDGSDNETLMRLADRALYLAKNGGRNQVRLSSAEASANTPPTPITKVPLRQTLSKLE